MENILIDCAILNRDLHRFTILDCTPIKTASGKEPSYKNLFIPGAIKVDIKKDFSDLSSKFPNTLLKPEDFLKSLNDLGINTKQTIVIYDGFGIYMSPRFYWMFKVMGFENILILNGGLPEWISQGFPTDSSSKVYPSKSLDTLNFNDRLTKSYEDIISNEASNIETVIDARSNARFNCEVPEPRAGLKGGIIINSFNLPFQEVIQNGKFKSKEELIKIFTDVENKKPIIFTCGSGVTACILWVASRIAQIPNTSVYDGSWTEYSMRKLG